MSDRVHEVSSKEAVLAAYDDAFLRWQVTTTGFQRAWVSDRAAVIFRLRGSMPQLIALGSADCGAALLDRVTAELPPGQLCDGSLRLTAEIAVATSLPASLQLVPERTDRWEWMWTRAQPPALDWEPQVSWTEDMDAVKVLLALANPRHHGIPGDPDIRGWAAVHDERGALLCTGALADLDTGVPHLRSITTAPHARGRGLAAGVSAFLTREGLRTDPPAVTLGLYSDNATARRLYVRLGYRLSHLLASGPLLRS